MGDMAEVFRDMTAAKKERRLHNTKSNTGRLVAMGIPFRTLNAGAHILIEGTEDHPTINFWPSTGLWMVQNRPEKHRGMVPLLKFLGEV